MYRFEIDRYIDAREIDWTDALDPRKSAATTQPSSRANFAIFQRPTMTAIRMSGTYEPMVRCVPSGAEVTVAPNASYEELFDVPASSYLMALGGNDGNGDGFRFQVRDLGSGRALATTALSSNFINTGRKQCFLEKPWHMTSGQLAVQVINRSNNANRIQLVLWLAYPSQDTDRIANVYDSQLATESVLSSGTPGTLAGLDAPTGDQYRVMPITGSPFLSINTATAPAASSTATITSFRVPPQTRAAITHIKHYYTGVGFNDGGPELNWTITADGIVIARGFELMNTQIGQSHFEALAGPITARAGQLVEYRATAQADLAGTITCGMQGFYYPA